MVGSTSQRGSRPTVRPSPQSPSDRDGRTRTPADQLVDDTWRERAMLSEQAESLAVLAEALGYTYDQGHGWTRSGQPSPEQPKSSRRNRRCARHAARRRTPDTSC